MTPPPVTKDPAPGLQELLRTTPYENPTFLGRGGSGVVYAVEHRFIGRRFALKRLHARHERSAREGDRLRVEAQSLARLTHPNVVDVVDFWIDAEGRPCIVMELLVGRTVSEELRARKRLPVREALAIARQALSALAAAHSIGIVHRDVKPENLFLHEHRGHGTVLKVLDFGLARILPDASSRAPAPLAVPTETNSLVGSPRFMSPEAARGERVDARADVFSLGAVLYALLTGAAPYDESAAPPPPSAVAGPEVTRRLDAIVQRSIAENPADRFATAAEFLAELKLGAELAEVEKR